MSNAVETNTDWIGVAETIGGYFGVAAPSILIWQAYYYLRHGVWQPISLIDALRYVNMKWAISPSDWIGLYHFLDWIPLSLLLLITGFSFAFVALSQER
jgi:hypothetical protein